MTERYAPFGARAIAWVVDAVPHALVPFLMARVTDSAAIGIGAFLVTGIVWSVVPEARFGMTLGKRLSGVQTVSADGRAALGLPRAALRWLVKYVVGGVLPVGYLWYFRDRSRRTWHDLAAGTVVRDLAGDDASGRPG